MVQRLPDRIACVALWVPTSGVLRPLEQANCPAPGLDDACDLHAINTRALCTGERVSVTELPRFPSALLEPSQTELSVCIEVILGEKTVNYLKGRADTHR